MNVLPGYSAYRRDYGGRREGRQYTDAARKS